MPRRPHRVLLGYMGSCLLMCTEFQFVKLKKHVMNVDAGDDCTM